MAGSRHKNGYICVNVYYMYTLLATIACMQAALQSGTSQGRIAALLTLMPLLAIGDYQELARFAVPASATVLIARAYLLEGRERLVRPVIVSMSLFQAAYLAYVMGYVYYPAGSLTLRALTSSTALVAAVQYAALMKPERSRKYRPALGYMALAVIALSIDVAALPLAVVEALVLSRMPLRRREVYLPVLFVPAVIQGGTLLPQAASASVLLLSRPEHLRYRRVPPPHSWIGAWIGGKYFGTSILGVGGFSYVIRAVDGQGNVYAIKLLKYRDESGVPLAENPHVVHVFRQEMSKYLLISSDHVVKVFEVHVPQDVKLPYRSIEEYLADPPYIVMEFLGGGTLRQLLNEKGALPLDRFADVALQIAESIRDVHRAGLAHLDLKPENIMFKDRARRTVKIVDLGSAKIAIGGSVVASQLSPAYAAPELLYGGRGTPESDIYSLGCIMYEMLTGINPQAFVMGGEKPPHPSRYNGAVPTHVGDVVLRCLDLDPRSRPTLDEIMDALISIRVP